MRMRGAMTRRTKRSTTTHEPAPGVAAHGPVPPRTVKRATNLTLDPAAVARGERYGARSGRSLSQLVNGFLAALPERADDEAAAALGELAPAVRRLHGAAAGSAIEERAYRAHLSAKYGATDG